MKIDQFSSEIICDYTLQRTLLTCACDNQACFPPITLCVTYSVEWYGPTSYTLMTIYYIHTTSLHIPSKSYRTYKRCVLNPFYIIENSQVVHYF